MSQQSEMMVVTMDTVTTVTYLILSVSDLNFHFLFLVPKPFLLHKDK